MRSPCPGKDTSSNDGDTSETADPTTKRCEYENAFTGEPECKEYTGVDWTTDTARTDCELNIPGGGGTYLEEQASCSISPMIGRCDVDIVPGSEYYIVMGGDSPDLCDGGELACEAFASGEFTPESVCEGETDSDHTIPIPPTAGR